MSSGSSAGGGGIGCLSLFGIIFVVLKLLAVQPFASWSWIWVLAPFWIQAILIVVILAVIVIAGISAARGSSKW